MCLLELSPLAKHSSTFKSLFNRMILGRGGLSATTFGKWFTFQLYILISIFPKLNGSLIDIINISLSLFFLGKVVLHMFFEIHAISKFTTLLIIRIGCIQRTRIFGLFREHYLCWEDALFHDRIMIKFQCYL